MSDTTPQVQASLERPETAPVASVNIEAGDGELAQRLKGMCGLSADIDIASPGGIERSMGKARRVIDKRPKR